MATSASLKRLLVLPDGEVHATFDDHTAVIINHTAATLAFACADGTITSHLARCVLSHNRAKATQALHARNTLCLDAPRLQWELLPPDRGVHYFDAAKRPLSVSWPSLPGEALRHADGSVRVVSLDGLAWLLLHPQQHVFAVCFPATAEASPEQMAEPVDLSQPAYRSRALAPTPARLVDAQRSVFCTQLHSATDDVPASWQHALRLALEAASTLPVPSGGAATGDGWVAAADLLFVGPPAAAPAPATGGRPLHAVRSMVAPLPSGMDASVPRSPEDAGVRVPLPRPGEGVGARHAASAARADWRLSTDVDALQAVSATALSTWLPKRGARLVLSPYALVRLLRPAAAAAAAASNEWLLQLMRLDSDAPLALSANGRFWDAGAAAAAAADDAPGWIGAGTAGEVAGAGGPRRVYAAGAVPPTLKCGAAPKAAAAKPQVALGALASCCEQLLREARRLPRAASAVGANAAGDADADADFDAAAAAEAASALLGEAEIDGLGRFRKYGDGRMIGSFVDRTVVTMLPPTLATAARGAADAPARGTVMFRWYLARVVFPDGRTTEVRSDCPVGAEAYVDAMLQFDGWASRTPQQRLEQARQQHGHARALQAEVARIKSHLAVSAAVTGEPPPLDAMGLDAADGTATTTTPAMPAGAGRISEELRRLDDALRPARADEPPPPASAATTVAPEPPQFSRACVAAELQRISQFLQVSA